MTASADEVKRAAALLRAGGVVAFPTETVYGLGAEATNLEAVRRVFAIKERPTDHPLIVHLATAQGLEDWARDIPATARLLAGTFWPGPLTLVLPRQPRVLDAVTGGQDSVALRVPAHPVARDLIAATGTLVAPSANRFGRVSPTTAQHVRDELESKVDMILDGGPCRVGVESTIVSLLHGKVVLLRPGGLSVEALESTLHQKIEMAPPTGYKVRVPGTLASHYAPATPLEIHPADALGRRALQRIRQGHKVAVLKLGADDEGFASSGIMTFPMPTGAGEYGRVLYATLHRLDHAGLHAVLVEAPPDTPEWLAVRDRLTRAACNLPKA
jgi:L-threonylcarbamoyladenylate synthase